MGYIFCRAFFVFTILRLALMDLRGEEVARGWRRLHNEEELHDV
jgi:hypothetical protein